MTQREKFLAAIVGLTLAVLVGQFGINRYRSALTMRQDEILRLNDQLSTRRLRQLEGAMSEARMGTFIMRSLPSNLEKAQGDYNSFLAGLVSEVGLSSAEAKYKSMVPVQDLYTQLNFNISGRGSLPQLIELLYKFHSKNYLHRIQSMVVRKERDVLVLNIDVQALALKGALPEAAAPTSLPPRVAQDIAAYMQPILNRNPISQPNQPPVYAAERSPEAVAGREFTYVARFNDPDSNQKVRYEVVGEAPPGLRLDDTTGAIRFSPEAVGEYPVTIRATDDGWPAKSAEQKLVIRAVEPPAAPEPEPEKPKFDESRQTFLTGLTQSRGAWTAMLLVRTRGETLKLKEGDSFNIGAISGTVVEVTNSYAVLESEGVRFTLSFDVSLAEAAKEKLP